MGHSKKEEERVERVIRGLLKLPENRRCINCNALGPQYVCTTFSTFVCTNCSGLHREFTHRVKSVSMAKFTPDEVIALQAGGNERAKQIYFKGWDPLRHSYPDSSNMHRLRDFIKHVYVDRKYTGERSQAILPRIKLNDKEESNESNKSSSFKLEFVSPRSSPGARSHDASFRYEYDESRSPKYVQRYSRHGGFSRSPIKFEVVDDRFRDDEYRNRRHLNLESKLRQLSLDGQKNVDRSQVPVQRSLGEVMMENDSSLQVTTSGGEGGSIEEKQSEPKCNKSKSFNDLSSTKSQASDIASGTRQESTQTITHGSENNWASFEASTEENVPKTPNTNTMKPCTPEPKPEAKISNPLDLLLLELSSPFTPTSSGISEVPSGDIVPTTTIVEKEKDSTWDFPSTSMEEQTSNEAPTLQSEIHETEDSVEVLHGDKSQIEDSIEVSQAHEPPSMQNHPSVGCSSTTQPIDSPNNDVALNNEQPFSINTYESSSHDFTEPSSQTTSNPTQDTKSPDVGSQPSKMETKFIGRKELPEDLFTTSYLSGPAPHAGWQNLQSHVMGYGMQYYPNAMAPSGLPIAPKSMNPFEVTEGRSIVHASSFPTMESLHGMVPSVTTRTGLMHASSLSSLDTMMPHSTSYVSPITGVSFDQVNNEEQNIRLQRGNTFNSDITGFGSLDNIQQSYGGYGTLGTSSSFSNTRGNPFE